MSNIESVVTAWKSYRDTIRNWKELIKGIEPKKTGCGPVYEMRNPIDRPDESFAIADMRNLQFTEPHYHPDGVTEIYIVLQGSGLVVNGGEKQNVSIGSVIVTPPNTAHFTIPTKDLVVAVINTPPFKPEDYIVISGTDPVLGFDKEQFERLSGDK